MPRKAKPKATKQYFPEVELREPLSTDGHYAIVRVNRTHFEPNVALITRDTDDDPGREEIPFFQTAMTKDTAERIVALLNDTRTIPTVALKEHLVLSSLRHIQWLAEDQDYSDEGAEYYVDDAREIMDKHKFELPEE